MNKKDQVSYVNTATGHDFQPDDVDIMCHWDGELYCFKIVYGGGDSRMYTTTNEKGEWVPQEGPFGAMFRYNGTN